MQVSISSRLAVLLATACGLLAAAAVHSQCLLANPSFEHSNLAGWTSFGPVGTSTNAAHGSKSARVTGPNSGSWNVSGLWQSLPCVAGQQFTVSTWLLNSSLAPLAGGSSALLNVEWHDAAGNLISYESHTAASALTSLDTWGLYTAQSAAAPAGTASIHYLLGVLQGPADPTPQVLFDEANCISLGPPTHDAIQWTDFPSGRTLSFAGRTWRVKGTGYYGPGPNLFDSSANAAWVDSLGRLSLTIHKIGGSWYSSEVALTDELGYGDYVFTTRGRLDTLDPNTVLGMFTWEYGPCYDVGYLWWNPFNEIDVEVSRWGSPANADAQFVAQPASNGGNVSRFSVAYGDTEQVSYAMRWLPGSVAYRCWRGGPDDEATSATVAAWTYAGADLPRPESPRVHLNLWQLAAPTVTQSAVFSAFAFHPACPTGNCGVLDVGALAPVTAHLAPAEPNPFVGRTAFRWTLERAGDVELRVYDLAGRAVRRLVVEVAQAGPHVTTWDGLDDAGRRVIPGVYFYRLRAGGRSESKRVVVLR